MSQKLEYHMTEIKGKVCSSIEKKNESQAMKNELHVGIFEAIMNFTKSDIS